MWEQATAVILAALGIIAAIVETNRQALNTRKEQATTNKGVMEKGFEDVVEALHAQDRKMAKRAKQNRRLMRKLEKRTLKRLHKIELRLDAAINKDLSSIVSTSAKRSRPTPGGAEAA